MPATGREAGLFPSGGLSNMPQKQTFHCLLTFGSGALASAIAKELKFTRSTNGVYTVKFPRTYRRIVGFRWGWTTFAAGAAVYIPVIIDSTQVAVANSDGTSTITVDTLLGSNGVATDPATGSVLSLEFDVSQDVNIDNYTASVT